MISPNDIQWNTLWATALPFDIITQCSFDGDSGDSETFLGREAVVSETYNGAIKRGNSYKWNESFAPTITILKKDFSDFTREENRYILSWLTGKQTPGFLDVSFDDSRTIEYSILGNFINVSQYKLGNSRIVGYIAQFESLMPWALSRLIEEEISGAKEITVVTDDKESAVYPRITIQNRGANNIKITNAYAINGQTYVATCSINNNTADEKIVLDGANKVVLSSRTSRIFGDDFSWEWLPLYNGVNTITVEGNCDVLIEYREVRKVGEY